MEVIKWLMLFMYQVRSVYSTEHGWLFSLSHWIILQG
jgi:hypothetical protein